MRPPPRLPKTYPCPRADGPIVVDGRMDEGAWSRAPWTDDFVDIEGAKRPAPRFRTRAKMLWDDECFYVAAELAEPHVNATLTKKNSIIFHDNDFEVFIDPDGDNHNYYEFEVNALNTIWELTLPKPYRAGGHAKHGTNLRGLKSAVHVRGTLNDPSDTDVGWSLEIAFPWAGLAAYRGRMPCPPRNGDQWRVDFSRVEWLFDIIDGRYRKIPKAMRAEDNWVWSPPGVIDMHRPWHWGVVQFCGPDAEPTVARDPVVKAQQLLMQVYEAQRQRRDRKEPPASSVEELGLGLRSGIRIEVDGARWQAHLPWTDRNGKAIRCHVRQDQLFWVGDVPR